MVAVLCLLCWAPAPFCVFVGVSLCCLVRLFLTGGNAFLPNAWIWFWFALLCHHVVYRLFVSSYDLVLLLLFLTQRTEPLSRIGRTRGKKNTGLQVALFLNFVIGIDANKLRSIYVVNFAQTHEILHSVFC